MQFDDLTPENQVKYLALEKKMFGKRKFKLNNACKSLEINYYEGFAWWSCMLKKHASPISDNPTPNTKPLTPEELCPSCGLQKHAVKNTDECRDVFHYL